MATTHLKNVSIIRGNVSVNVDLAKYADRLKDAQRYLDSQIMNDMVPYMPRVTGDFIQLTRGRSAALAGSGVVCAAAGVFGRYLYYGKLMVNSQTGKGPARYEISPGEFAFRYREGSKLVATQRPLKYSNPYAEPEWFEVAKKKNLKNWRDGVEDILVNGRKP